VFNLPDVFQDLAMISELVYEEHINVREDHRLIREYMGQLQQKFLAPYNEEIENEYSQIEWANAEENWNQRSQTAGVFLDLLGIYLFDSDPKEILIFTKMCEIVAYQLGLDPQALVNVVCAHEEAHAVTHMGKDNPDEDSWESFADASVEDVELFAQVYPLFYFKDQNDADALLAFRKLSVNQPSQYKAWQYYESVPRDVVNTDLRLVRLLKNPNPRIFLVDSIFYTKITTTRGLSIDVMRKSNSWALPWATPSNLTNTDLQIYLDTYFDRL